MMKGNNPGGIMLQVGFLCGTDVDEAAERIVELAHQWNVGVEGDFNGRTLWAMPTQTKEDVLLTWWCGSERRKQKP